MTAELKRYCRGGDLELDGKTLRVALAEGRTHRLSVIDEPDAYVLTGVVVRASIVSQILDLPVQAWQRNRSTRLVGFKIDSRDRLIGEAWVPKAGLTGVEFRAYVRAVAAECDRFEYELTGKDAS